MCQCGLEFSIILKSNFNVELQCSVDCERTTWAVSVVCEFGGCVYPAVSAAVAVRVEPIRIWCVTGMRRCLEGPLVCLHDIKFRAEVSTNLIGVTVVVSVCVPGISIYIFAWCLEQVKGSNAATVT